MSGELPSRFPRLRRFVRDHWGIIFITFLAAAFRFAYFDLIPYWWDESRNTYLALQILEEGKFPLQGPITSIPLPHPPLMAYIQVLALLFVRSPLAVQFSIALLNLLAVPLTYFTALRLFDRRTATSAAFIYSITPLAVYFSRLTWAPGLLPFFTSLVAYLLFPAFLEREKDRRLFFGMMSTGLMAFTYLPAYAAFVQIALLFLVFHRGISWKPVFMGTFLVLLLSLPYAYSLLFSEELNSSNTVASFGKRAWKVDPRALQQTLRLVNGLDAEEFASARPRDYNFRKYSRNFDRQGAAGGITLLLILGIGEGIFRILRKDRGDHYLLLLIWFFTPIALMTAHIFLVKPLYLLITFPSGFILAGAGTRRLWRIRWLMPLLGLALVIIFWGSMTNFYGQIKQPPDIGKIFRNPYIGLFEWLSPRYSFPLGRTVRETTSEVYIHASKEWISAVSGTLIRPYQEFEEGNFLVLRADHPALYVLLDPKELSPAFSSSQELADRRIYLPNDGSIRFFLFPSRSEEDLASLPSHPLNLQLDTGWRLMGYDLSQQASPGDTLELTTYWLVENLPPPRERNSLFLKPFAHLLDENGNAVAIGDGHGQAGNLWRKGDFYIDTLSFVLPNNASPGEYWLSLGLYDPNTGIRAIFPNGQDNILVGPLTVHDRAIFIWR